MVDTETGEITEKTLRTKEMPYESFMRPIWLGMIRNLKTACQETGRNCRVQMDLAGPKLRTGPIEPGPAVVRCRPKRDLYGQVVTPARIWLTPGG